MIPKSRASSGVKSESCLISLADGFYSDNQDDLSVAKENVERELGLSALVDAAGIIGIFDGIVRVADATGIPLEKDKIIASKEIRLNLGINNFHPDKK
tara:strand:- start:378 stop:671 length:294 start_codon:yes stop_codon:yes gene_type:complete